MGFKADEAVPELDWDFTKYGAGSGVSPEPSSEELVVFHKEWRTAIEAIVRTRKAMILKEQQRLDGMSREDLQAETLRWAEMDLDEAILTIADEQAEILADDAFSKTTHKQALAIAKVFHDCPSVEQIEKLPARVRAAYFGWVVGQLINPESGAAGTS